MRKTIVVAVREYTAAVKTKAFVISMVAMPLIWGAAAGVQFFLQDKVDTNDKRIAVVDTSGVMLDTIIAAAKERNETDVFTGEGAARKQVRPRFVLETVEPDRQDAQAQDLDLSGRVRDKKLLAYLVIAGDVIDSSAERGLTVRYHSNSPTYDDFVRWVRPIINDRVQQLRLAAANLDADVVRRATMRTSIENLGLVSVDESGVVKPAERTNKAANMFVPMGLMMLMFMTVMVGAAPLMQSVLEEKMQRIAEVLLASVPPFQLMMGKLLGMVGVSLTIGTVYLVGAFLAIRQAGYGQFFPVHVIWWFVVFQSLAVLMFGSLFIAIGAAVTDLKESQSMMTPVMLLVMAPLFVWLQVVKEPSSSLATVMSLVPPMTPMLMLLRLAVPPGIPVWQPLLGVLLVLLTTVVTVFAAGRIFRVGILMQGKGAKVGEMMRWVLRG